jgi:hypothetical protein
MQPSSPQPTPRALLCQRDASQPEGTVNAERCGRFICFDTHVWRRLVGPCALCCAIFVLLTFFLSFMGYVWLIWIQIQSYLTCRIS